MRAKYYQDYLSSILDSIESEIKKQNRLTNEFLISSFSGVWELLQLGILKSLEEDDEISSKGIDFVLIIFPQEFFSKRINRKEMKKHLEQMQVLKN